MKTTSNNEDHIALPVTDERYSIRGDVELEPLVRNDLDYASIITGKVDGASHDDDDTTTLHHRRLQNHHSQPPLQRKQSFHDWFFSTQEPPAVQLTRWENLAIPACYLCVGLSQGLSRPLLNVYPLDLGATEAQQTTIASLAMLPCTFKIFFGFLSDQIPLFRTRRKGYMMAGWCVASMSMVFLMTMSDLTRPDVEDTSHGIPQNAPSMELLSLLFLMFGTGYWMADVMGDSIVAERAKLEPDNLRGQLQSSCYACRFFGMMVSAPLSTVLYSTGGPLSIVVLMSAIPVVIMAPAIYLLQEMKPTRVLSAREQCQEIWKSVCSRAVWQPMGFVFLYNVLRVSNSAWRQFLKTVLAFTANQLNTLLIVAYVLLYLGTLAYKYYFISFSWRLIFQVGILLNGLFSSLQVLLILNITFGLNPFVFALGDDVFTDLILGIQFLPTTIMMVHLCPSGSEGASYAMFTTVSNAGMLLAPTLSTVLLPIWDVSKEALEEGRLSGLLKLTVLTTLIQTSAFLFVGLLPRDRHELELLKTRELSTSRVGGALFLGIILCSTLYSATVGILNIVVPGWAGES